MSHHLILEGKNQSCHLQKNKVKQIIIIIISKGSSDGLLNTFCYGKWQQTKRYFGFLSLSAVRFEAPVTTFLPEFVKK